MRAVRLIAVLALSLAAAATAWAQQVVVYHIDNAAA